MVIAKAVPKDVHVSSFYNRKILKTSGIPGDRKGCPHAQGCANAQTRPRRGEATSPVYSKKLRDIQSSKKVRDIHRRERRPGKDGKWF